MEIKVYLTFAQYVPLTQEYDIVFDQMLFETDLGHRLKSRAAWKKPFHVEI